jgi:NAD+ synthase (glutamine-hydrolysing)
MRFQIITRAAQFGIEEVEVTSATIDLEEIRSYRNGIRSRNLRAASSNAYPRIEVNILGSLFPNQP